LTLVQWQKAAKCPCIPTEGSEQPDFNCALCHGKGHVWSDPLTIRGIMTNFNENQKYNQTGEMVMGVSYFTTLPQYRMNFWDRVTNFHSTIRYDEVKAHGEHGGTDKLRFQPIEIVSVRTLETVYENGVDYTIDKNIGVSWVPGGQEPPTGERVSISYLMHPSWIVMDLTNVIRDTYVKSKKPGLTFQQLPQRATVKLEYFVWA